MALTASDFDYDLPEELIAQTPVTPPDRSRLMVLDRATGSCRDHVFGDLPGFLGRGDVLVVNDTRVVPARFTCVRATGGRIEGLYLRTVAAGRWEVMLKGAGRCRPGEAPAVEGADPTALTLRRSLGGGVWEVDVHPPVEPADLLGRIGRTPLPPYIRRPGAMDEQADRRAYQTMFAARDGAVAAPTAGLHFTPAVMHALAVCGVGRATVTLHVGLGTFAPVKVEDLADHPMHAEWYELTDAEAETIRSARARGRRVVAVGTTSVRVLETASASGTLQAGQGWTDLFIRPPRTFRAVDALVTNFHLPRSTLLMLVAAFCSPGSTDGVKTILDAYAHAVRARYRFYSYGDAMLIL
ncbi:MAG TPA: tRNA preQ1(34) S-adenosylmethionine ribosyltransferase-isomerase QueA [Phycisphaerae bacterium]|nr:tRNA preQ1(34) S-adenosylmethionine ribosyltransferase-isomerase QueA [Phycisphaerae bacterium]